MEIPAPDRLPDRVMVYGVTGSGKTTMARRIAEAVGREWVNVDDLTWMPGWQEVPVEEQRRRFQDICDGEVWLMDTAYGKWIDIPLARVQLIIALDYPRWFSFQRLVRRALARAIDRRPICNGNVESFRLMFSKDSIILWHFKSFSSKRGRIEKWASDPNGPVVVRFRKAAEAERWLKKLCGAFDTPT